jgi:hypothetical protein
VTVPLPPIYADENVSGILVRALKRLGWDVSRAIDTHPSGTDDQTHFQEAVKQDRVLLSNDQDMVVIAAEWQAQGRSFPGVIYFSPKRFASIGDVIRALQALAAKLREQPLAHRVAFL